MGHEEHHHEEHHHEEKPLSFFASPLHEPSHEHGHASQTHTSVHSSDIEEGKPKTADPNHVPFDNMDCEVHNSPAFHRHAEATTAELFYDLFFVANLTTFTSNLEINDKNSLTAYIGFFALLWLTWYQVSLYDVRFSADSVFERVAKGIHFGVMVGFAVIGPQWKPGQEVFDYKIYKAFGLILMVSRITLFLQYGVTLFYTRKYKKTVIPLAMVMASTFMAAILYGALTPAFPKAKLDGDGNPKGVVSNVYIAWYIIAVMETLLTVGVSMIMRVISFKGTHMVQRMSLLTLIILGEGIIVVCKSISKIVKNDYLWSAAVVGQIIAAILIIYFLYMSYFDRLHEEHFGSIKQQIWSFLHFPLHTVLVLVLQGVSILIIWRQAVEAMDYISGQLDVVITNLTTGAYSTGEELAGNLTDIANYVFAYVPKGVDATAAREAASVGLAQIVEGFDNNDGTNTTAMNEYVDGINALFSATYQTLFDSLSVSIPKKKDKSGAKKPDVEKLGDQYYAVFHLVVYYVFIAGGMALLINALMGFLSLPKHKQTLSGYLRLGINALAGVGLCLVVTIKFNSVSLDNYMQSAWMIPTVCIVMFLCVLVNHVRIPKRKVH